MSTWRELTFTPTTTDFTRTSRSGSVAELTGNVPVYEYVLQEPVEVQEGDFLGFDLSPEGDEELQFVFQNLGAGNAPVSYARSFTAMTINTQLVTRNRRYVPLITAVIGENVYMASDRHKVVMFSLITNRFSRWYFNNSCPPHLHPSTHTHTHSRITNHTSTDRYENCSDIG